MKGMSIQMARAELQEAMSGPAGRHWNYGPAVSAVLAALEQAEQRIAELEAQASAHDRLCDSNYIAGMKMGWNLGIVNDNARFNQCLAARARRYPDDTDSLKIEGE